MELLMNIFDWSFDCIRRWLFLAPCVALLTIALLGAWIEFPLVFSQFGVYHCNYRRATVARDEYE